MAAASFRDFLESSTIHGLVHISTAKSTATRAVWVAIVVACFATAIYMITGSYKEVDSGVDRGRTRRWMDRRLGRGCGVGRVLDRGWTGDTTCGDKEIFDNVIGNGKCRL